MNWSEIRFEQIGDPADDATPQRRAVFVGEDSFLTAFGTSEPDKWVLGWSAGYRPQEDWINTAMVLGAAFEGAGISELGVYALQNESLEYLGSCLSADAAGLMIYLRDAERGASRVDMVVIGTEEIQVELIFSSDHGLHLITLLVDVISARQFAPLIVWTHRRGDFELSADAEQDVREMLDRVLLWDNFTASVGAYLV